MAGKWRQIVVLENYKRARVVECGEPVKKKTNTE
jgi:hypothetical protein